MISNTLCPAGQRVSLTITGPEPSFSPSLSPRFWRTGEEIPLSWTGWKPGYPAKTNKEILEEKYGGEINHDVEDRMDTCLMATCPLTTRLFCSTKPGIRSMACAPKNIRWSYVGDEIQVQSFICDLGPTTTPNPSSTPTSNQTLTSNQTETSTSAGF